MTAWIAGPQFPDVADNLVEEEDDGKPFNIFEYIGRPTAERGVRHKLSGDSARKMGKLDALRQTCEPCLKTQTTDTKNLL